MGNAKLSPELLPTLLLVTRLLPSMPQLLTMLITMLPLLTMLKRLTMDTRLLPLYLLLSPKLLITNCMTMLVLWECMERRPQLLQWTVTCHLLRPDEDVLDEGKDADKEGVEEGETRGGLLREEDNSEDRLLTAGFGKSDLYDTYNLKDPS